VNSLKAESTLHNNDATAMQMGTLEICFIDPATPATADLIVVEEDTCGLLNAPAEIRHPNEHPVRLYTALHGFVPMQPGSIHIQGQRLSAIVIDVDAQPPCNPEWVKSALQKIFMHAGQRQAGCIELPLLGNRHGKLSIEISLQLIREAVLHYPQAALHKIQLRMHEADFTVAHRILSSNS
jgi:hypothetical protein